MAFIQNLVKFKIDFFNVFNSQGVDNLVVLDLLIDLVQ